MEPMALPELGERWYCPNCTIRKVCLFPLCEFYKTFSSHLQQHPPPKPTPSFIAPLIHQAQTSMPKEFQLPDDIRNFFKDGAFFDG
jgi:hypothetical protein